jgi:WD repeat and SOF domain-containing protein 1
MKIQAIARSEADYTRSRRQDLYKTFHNPSPKLHPFAQQREYVRALNAAKLDRLFAQPFVASLEGHLDGVYTMQRHPDSVGKIFSGSGDGQIRVWDLGTRSCLWKKNAHTGRVRGGVWVPGQNWLISVGDDKTTRIWNVSNDESIATLTGHSCLTFDCD